MPLPPFILGLALLLWGWQTHFIGVAVPLALLFEGARLMRFRWEFSVTDYQKIWNGCLVLLLASVLFAIGYSNTLRESTTPLGAGDRSYGETLPLATLWALLFFQWQPLIFAPFVAAVIYGGRDRLPLTVFSWWARRHERLDAARVSAIPVREVAVQPLYFALVLVAASTSNRRNLIFIAAFWILLGLALWPRRSKRTPVWAWLITFTLMGSLGFAGQVGLNQLQKFLMNLDSSWLQRFVQNRTNPMESRTKIGSIGDLKLSGRIVLRVQVTNDVPAELLREASYDSYYLSTWSIASKGESLSGKLDWREASQEDVPTSWSLVRDARTPPRASMNIAMYLRGGRGLLPIPTGTLELHDVPAGTVRRNNYGGVQVLDGPGLLNYQAVYGFSSTLDRRPTEKDLDIHPSEREAVQKIAEQLNLQVRKEAGMVDVLRTVRSFFLNNFRYSTFQDTPHKDQRSNKTPLAHFLTWQRAGHCEFFATATTLVLRAAGIPARYAVGYSVQESSGSGNYVVRERHAHAWCLVWSEEQQSWEDFDTTPPGWNQVESENASAWEPIADLGSRLWFEYSEWRAGRSELTKYLIGFLVVLLLVFVARLFLVTQRKRSAGAATVEGTFQALGLDSEYYQVEKALAAAGLRRGSEETAAQLLRRAASVHAVAGDAMRDILSLHYRLRFDPAGLPPEERSQLKSSVERTLSALRRPS